jgi:hypothetical protein
MANEDERVITDPNDDQITPNPVEPDGDDEPELYAGKFKSAKDLEKAYTELQSLRSKDSDRLARLEEKYEEIELANQPEPELEPAPITEDKTDLLARFYSDPAAVLKAEREAAKAEARAEAQQLVAAERTLSRYYAANPDLVQHEELISFAFKKTPANLNPAERLSRAGDRVREMLGSPKAPKAKGGLTADDFVESPDAADNPTRTVSTRVMTPDEELKEYLALRKKETDRGTRPPTPMLRK